MKKKSVTPKYELNIHKMDGLSQPKFIGRFGSESLYTIYVSWSSRTGGRSTLCSKVIPLAMSSASLAEPVRRYSTLEWEFMLVAMEMDRKEAALICSHKIQHLSKTKQGILAIQVVP